MLKPFQTPILWPPDAKNWLIWKDAAAGKGWRLDEKGMTEDEMVGCHHRLNGHELEQALGVGDGQGSLVFCSPWGHKESDTTEWLNWTESLIISIIKIKSEFGNKEFMIWATVSSQSCFCWLYRVSPSLAANNIISLILVLTIWWSPCVESSLVLLEEGVC